MGWPLKPKDLKRYPHFDGIFTLAELERIATDPQLVAQNAFFPFLLYYQSWRPFRKAGIPSNKKKRPIRYACRRDGAIFSYYRHTLSELYEASLRDRGINSCPLAYRKIPAKSGKRGKCNIDFAAEAFQKIKALGECCVATLDISSYFESIDHARLYKIWCQLLEVTKLPPDHAAVFRAITQHTVVDVNDAYLRLGFVGPKQLPNGTASTGFLVHRDSIPIQLCSPADFRKKICGGDKSLPKLVRQNKESYGIPQGAPISDLLANIYLMDFDKLLNEYATSLGGAYYRYSDDIFVVVPGGESAWRDAAAFASTEIRKFGDQIQIKDKKTAIVSFTPTAAGTLTARRIDNARSQSGLEYLGFRFDGNKVYVRDSTMSRFHRKMRTAARYKARGLVRRYAGQDYAYILDKFNPNEFATRFGRVANFSSDLDHRRWTFRTYIKRCSQVFEDSGHVFFKQVRNHRKFLERAVATEIRRALRTSPA